VTDAAPVYKDYHSLSFNKRITESTMTLGQNLQALLIKTLSSLLVVFLNDYVRNSNRRHRSEMHCNVIIFDLEK
jgi:hypothetical protein